MRYSELAKRALACTLAIHHGKPFTLAIKSDGGISPSIRPLSLDNSAQEGVITLAPDLRLSFRQGFHCTACTVVPGRNSSLGSKPGSNLFLIDKFCTGKMMA